MYVNSLVHYGISNKIEEIPIPIIDKENKEKAVKKSRPQTSSHTA